MFYLVTYDIPSSGSGDRRRTQLAKRLEGFGLRVQYSVFEIEISPERLPAIIEELELSYFAIPAFVRYGSDDENLVGNVSYETFLRYFHGGNKIPSYKGKTKTRWNINGDFSPSKETLIKHMRTDKDHVAVASWPLELLSREDLTALHSDLHNKDYGQIEWRDK
jgi:hypothetical protein